MKIKHFFALIASFFLSACSTPTPNNSSTNNENNSIENAEIELSDELSYDVTPTKSTTEIEYAVSGDDETPRIITQKTIVEDEDKLIENNSDSSLYDNRLSSFSTKVYTKTSDRVKNLRIVCDRLSGTVLEPGEEFSYNDTCGPYNKENGFGKATVFVNGEEVQEYGGGVCQLSSTLYNAVKDIGVEILERHNHSKEVYYVPVNEDATVSYGHLDFRFKNTNSYPIEIHAFSDRNEVTVSIYKI